MFLKRLFSGIILIALSLLLIIPGGLILLFSTMALSLIGLFELYRAFSIQKSVPAVLGYVFTIVFYLNFIFPVFGPGTMMESFVFLFIAFLIALLAAYVFLYPKYGPKEVFTAFFGIFYAMSAYLCAYSWNIMWLDCLWLAPLIVLGLERLVKEKGIKVTATAIFSQPQALMAAVAGADYVAPYVNKIDSIAGCSANVIAEMVTLFEAHNLDTKILAASFRNAEQVHQVALAGGHAATMRPEMFMELISHPFTDIAVENFNRDWKGQYGKNLLEIL